MIVVARSGCELGKALGCARRINIRVLARMQQRMLLSSKSTQHMVAR
jgi:hypothetical protein